MKRTISLDAQTAKEHAKDGKTLELGPTRIFDRAHRGPVVLPIKGRRFLVIIQTEFERYQGVPEPGHVTFVETDEPETPHTIWDGIAVTKEHLEDKRRSLAILTEQGPEKGYEKYHEEDLANLRRDIERHESAIAEGEPFYRVTTDSAFGQPKWIQGEWAPLHEGKPVYHLMTLETGWGDAGNENYMVALDEDGWPVAVYWEASCC